MLAPPLFFKIHAFLRGAPPYGKQSKQNVDTHTPSDPHCLFHPVKVIVESNLLHSLSLNLRDKGKHGPVFTSYSSFSLTVFLGNSFIHSSIMAPKTSDVSASSIRDLVKISERRFDTRTLPGTLL